MKIASLFCLFVLAFCSCNEPKQEKRVYTEKDIEGYWATNSVIQSSSLTNSFVSSSTQSVAYTLLRLYNDVCGMADTAYKVKGDTLLLEEYDEKTQKFKFVKTHFIDFVSVERIVLTEIDTRKQITYYSLLSIPNSQDHCESVSVIASRGGMGLEVKRDSVRSIYIPLERDICWFGSSPKSVSYRTDSVWFERINKLYCRVTSDEILFAQEKTRKTFGIDSEVLVVPVPPGKSLELCGNRGVERVGDGLAVVNPVIRAFYLEMLALESKRWDGFEHTIGL